MSEHQSGAGGAPDQGPCTDAQGHGSSPETAAKGPGQQGAVGGYGQAQPGPAEGQGQAQGTAHADGQANSPQGGQQGGGQGESMGPQHGDFVHGGAGAVPPGYGPAHYTHPAPGPGVGAPGEGYHAAPHYAAAMHYGQYAGYPPPPPPGAYPPDAYQGMMHQGHAYGAAQGAGHAQGARMSDLMEEVANGGNGLSTLSKMLNFDDPDFWKGALVGAAAVLLLTSESVQNALFKTGGSTANGNGDKESGT